MYDKTRSTVEKDRAREVLERQSELETVRRDYEAVWSQVADFCDPDGSAINWSGGRSQATSLAVAGSQASRADERARKVYDNTIGSATDRLSAGLESLITPQSEKWHGISTASMNDPESQEEKEWGESLRDFIFSDVRYRGSSNFVPSIQSCYMNVVRYGPAYLYAEESFGHQLIRYASIPVNEAYIARNRFGDPDIYHRVYTRTARECAQMFGEDKLPDKIRMLCGSTSTSLQRVSVIQCVQPRSERRTYDLAGEKMYLDSPFVSYHVIEGEEVIVRERPFRTFPVSCFNWRRHEGDVYGISPTIKALTTVRELNAVRRSGLRALQQVTDPPTATAGKVDDLPVLNPGQNFPGMMSDNGELLIKGITTGQKPEMAFEYAKQRAEDVKDMLYVNLFQTLVANPQMTATEALIRQDEKGALLGPAGSIIQSGFESNLDREVAILEDKGLYDPDSRFLPPASLAGKRIHPTFTSPLDILRRAAEAKDTIQLVGTALQMAQFDPSVMDNLDPDEAIKVVQGAGRAPMRVLRDENEVKKIREARAQAQKAQQGMQAMQAMAATASDAVPAAQGAKELMQGLLPPRQPGA